MMCAPCRHAGYEVPCYRAERKEGWSGDIERAEAEYQHNQCAYPLTCTCQHKIPEVARGKAT
jgi:hypothetical protein